MKVGNMKEASKCMSGMKQSIKDECKEKTVSGSSCAYSAIWG